MYYSAKDESRTWKREGKGFECVPQMEMFFFLICDGSSIMDILVEWILNDIKKHIEIPPSR